MKRFLLIAVSTLLMAGEDAAAQTSAVSPASVAPNAYGIAAMFVVQNHATALPPTPAVAGGTAPYDRTVTLQQLNTKLALIASQSVRPTLFVNAADLAAHTAAPVGVDTITRESDVAGKNITVSLNLDPLPPSTVHPQPYLNITAGNMVSSARYVQQIPGTPTVSGATKFGRLTISGQLVNGSVLNFSGPIKPNTIVYETANVTITLNRQVTASVAACTSGCAAQTVIAVDAISVALNKAAIDGMKVTGNITVGHSLAH